MPRTDENGRQLKALLDYLLDGDVDAKAIYDALGTSSSTYYRRIKEADYPNAEELRQVADRFGLSYPGPPGSVWPDEPRRGVELPRVRTGDGGDGHRHRDRHSDRPAAKVVGTQAKTRRAAALAVEFATKAFRSKAIPMALAVLIAITLTCIAWSLWIRRVTWSCRWEVAATLNIALQGAAVLLMSPIASETLGHWLHAATGMWNLEDYVGHDMYIVAASAIVYNALGRLQDDHAMQATFKQYVERPATHLHPAAAGHLLAG